MESDTDNYKHRSRPHVAELPPAPVAIVPLSAAVNGTRWPDKRLHVIRDEINEAIRAAIRHGCTECVYWLNGRDVEPPVIEPIFQWVEAEYPDSYCDDPTPSGSVLLHIVWRAA